MQHVNRRSHQQAPIHFRLELARKPVTGRRFAHFVEQLSVFVKEIKALEIFLLDFFIQPESFFLKAVQEQLLDLFKAFLAIRGIGLTELVHRANPVKRCRMRHRHAMSVRNLVCRHQAIIQELRAAAVSIIRKREILDAIEVRCTSKRILAHFHIRIAKEHSRSTTAPQERILSRIAEISSRLNPHTALEVAITNAEPRPLAL